MRGNKENRSWRVHELNLLQRRKDKAEIPRNQYKSSLSSLLSLSNCREQMGEPGKEIGAAALYWVEYAKKHTPPDLDKVDVGFYDSFVAGPTKIERVEKGRVVCSFKVTPSHCNLFKVVHGGIIASLVDIIGTAAIISTGTKNTGVSVDINVSYVSGAKLGEEVEIDAKCLRVGKYMAQVSVDFFEKKTGRVVAQGRHTKFLSVPKPKL